MNNKATGQYTCICVCYKKVLHLLFSVSDLHVQSCFSTGFNLDIYSKYNKIMVYCIILNNTKISSPSLFYLLLLHHLFLLLPLLVLLLLLLLLFHLLQFLSLLHLLYLIVFSSVYSISSSSSSSSTYSNPSSPYSYSYPYSSSISSSSFFIVFLLFVFLFFSFFILCSLSQQGKRNIMKQDETPFTKTRIRSIHLCESLQTRGIASNSVITDAIGGDAADMS